MVLRIVFISYIAFLSAFDGFLDQEAHESIFTQDSQSAYSQNKDLVSMIDTLSEDHQEQKGNNDCPDPENCHSCHQCMGHCGALLASFNLDQNIYRDSNYSSLIKALISRELAALFRPPILS